MSQKIKTTLFQALPVIVIATLLVVAIIYAWTEPSQAPPGCPAGQPGCDAPINVSATNQYKTGGLGVGGAFIWGTGRGTLALDQGASIELGGSGTPYLDFSNDATSDYDMRLILTGDDALAIVGGNVGIGDTSPDYKLDVYGQLNVSRDDMTECCSGGDFTLSVAEGTNVTGRRASIQFHNSGESEGYLRLNPGPHGRELLAGSYQTDMDLRATGVVRGDGGLCIGNDCRTAWPSGSMNQNNCISVFVSWPGVSGETTNINDPLTTCPVGYYVAGVRMHQYQEGTNFRDKWVSYLYCCQF